MASAGRAAAAGRRDAPPPAAAAAATVARVRGFASEPSTRLLDCALSLCCCSAQVWGWHASTAAPGGPAGGYAAQAALLAAQVAALGFVLAAPRRAWRAHRAWAIAAMRLPLVAHEPFLHRTHVGPGFEGW